jgi:hypothetical protein
MAEFTREYLDDARIEGYTDDEIISHITKTRPDIQNALEDGYSLNEIADFHSKDLPKKEEKAEEGPTAGQIAAGLAADIAVAEGSKYAGAAAGAALGSAGFTLGPVGIVTVPAGTVGGYVIGALGGGWSGSILAQKIEGANEINYGRATVDTLLNLIPFGGGKVSKMGKAGGALEKFSGIVRKRPIATGMVLGATATPAYMAVDEIQDRKEYTLNDYIKGMGTSMALGAGLGGTEKLLTRGVAKIRNKTPDEINKLIEQGDPTTIELVDYLTAGVSPSDVRAAPAKFTGSVADYIKNATKATASKLAPSRVVGNEATTAISRAKSAVEAVEGTSANLGKQIDSYLETNPQYRDDAIAFLDGQDRPNLPPELLDKLIYGRSKIRTEQQRMIDLHNSGQKLLPENKAEIIEESLNRGDYLTRAYRFFQDPNYKPSKEKYDALRNRLIADGVPEAETNKYLAELQVKMKGNPEEFSQFMQGPGTPNVLKQRKVVSKELEDYLGLIEKPGERVGTTMSILNRINEYNESDAKIARALFDSGAAVKATDANAQGLQKLNLRRGAATLDGEELYVDPYVQTAINKLYASGIDEQSKLKAKQLMQDIYETAVSGLKSAKVLGNLSSYLIQVPGNLAITLAGGMNPAKGLGTAVKMSLGSLAGTKLGGAPLIRKVANEAPPLTLQQFEDLKRREIITGNVAYEDLKVGLQGKRLGKAFEKVIDTPGRIYSIPDNIFRVINYENNMATLKKMMPTATEEQIKEMGARLTKKTYPNYDSISPELKALSRAGVMPQFVTYSLELARSQLAQARTIKEMANGTLPAKLGNEFADIPVNNVAMKKEAAKRLVAMATAYAAATYGINEFNRKTFTPEQERAYRDTVAADFEKDKPLLLYKKKDGSVGSINASYYLPQTIIGNTVMSVLRGENTEESTENLLGLLGTELVGEGSFAAQGFSSLVSGRDFETGNLISNNPNVTGKTLDRLENFGKEFVPTTITTMQKPGKSMEEKLIRQVGIREEARKIPEGFGFKARNIKESIGNIKSTVSGHQYALKDGRITPEQYDGLVLGEQKNYTDNMQKMVEHVKNLKTLGETDETIIPMLKQAKFSSIDTLNLLDGKVAPFDPVKKKTTSEVLDDLVGNNESETQKNIRELVKQDPVEGGKVLNAYKDRLKNKGVVQSPKEALLASLPTIEKVERLFPEIQSSRDPDSEIRRLFKKQILNENDVKAIQIRRQLK